MPFKTVVKNAEVRSFRIVFEADDSLNSLAILKNDVVIATDANVEDETYELPLGSYVASITFWGDVGTAGILEVQTEQQTRKRSSKIREGTVRESISIGFQLV